MKYKTVLFLLVGLAFNGFSSTHAPHSGEILTVAGFPIYLECRINGESRHCTVKAALSDLEEDEKEILAKNGIDSDGMAVGSFNFHISDSSRVVVQNLQLLPFPEKEDYDLLIKEILGKHYSGHQVIIGKGHTA